MNHRTPSPAEDPASRWWPKFLGAACAILFTLMFILPGYVAAIYTRLTPPSSSPFGTPLNPVMKGFLYPSEVLMDHSRTLNRFYNWEYFSLGGKVF